MIRVPKMLFASVISLLLVVSVVVTPAKADSLRIAPLEYRTTLKVGERQKGYVDISNPEADTVALQFEVEAFRQVDNNGNVTFYKDDAVAAGIELDLTSVELGPHESLRLMFVIDGTRLPKGEVFAAIFARTTPRDTTGVMQAVRVGTILEITNGNPGDNRAIVENFSAPFLQIGDTISAHFTVKNSSETGGFRPTVRFNVAPYTTKTSDGPLVFAGIARDVTYSQPGNYFGFVWLQSSVGSSSAGSWVFAVTGYWRWLAIMLLMACIALVWAIRTTGRKKH